MWTTEATAITQASRDQVWALLSDPATWHTWNPLIHWALLDDAFGKGARGQIKQVDGPTSEFIITDCTLPWQFVYETQLPGARLTFEHQLVESTEGTVITMRARLTGPLSWFWVLLDSRSIKKSVPLAVQTLAAIAVMT